jgi:hypothetical protein
LSAGEGPAALDRLDRGLLLLFELARQLSILRIDLDLLGDAGRLARNPKLPGLQRHRPTVRGELIELVSGPRPDANCSSA